MSILPDFVIEANDKPASTPVAQENEWNAPLAQIFGSKDNPDSGKRIAFPLPIEDPSDVVNVGKTKDGSDKFEIRALNDLRRKLDAAGASFKVDGELFPVTVRKAFPIRTEEHGTGKNKTTRTVADVKIWVVARQSRPRKAAAAPVVETPAE